MASDEQNTIPTPSSQEFETDRLKQEIKNLQAELFSAKVRIKTLEAELEAADITAKVKAGVWKPVRVEHRPPSPPPSPHSHRSLESWYTALTYSDKEDDEDATDATDASNDDEEQGDTPRKKQKIPGNLWINPRVVM